MTLTFKSRRTVRISKATASRRWAKLWGYGYADLAKLFGLSESGVRKAIRSGRLNPSDLKSVCRFWAEGALKLSPDELESLEQETSIPTATVEAVNLMLR